MNGGMNHVVVVFLFHMHIVMIPQMKLSSWGRNVVFVRNAILGAFIVFLPDGRGNFWWIGVNHDLRFTRKQMPCSKKAKFKFSTKESLHISYSFCWNENESNWVWLPTQSERRQRRSYVLSKLRNWKPEVDVCWQEHKSKVTILHCLAQNYPSNMCK